MNRKAAMQRAGFGRRTFLRWPCFGAAAVATVLFTGCVSESGRAESGTNDESAEPYSTPEGENPNATETNFFTIPCDEDADCADGERCIQTASDGGPTLGRCED
jgi:hypothetical protein